VWYDDFFKHRIDEVSFEANSRASSYEASSWEIADIFTNF